MNITSYIFGSFAKGYNQYPDDYTSEIFKKFKENSKSKTQIAIHRNNDIMYYGYIRNLEGSSYIGLCAMINGYYITSTKSLFSTFEKIIEVMVKNGYIIHFDNNGEIVTSVSRLSDNDEVLSEINITTSKLFDKLETSPLPAVNYSKASDSVKNFSIKDDDEKEIIKSSYSEGYTFLYKSQNYNTVNLQSYSGKIISLNKELSDLKKQQDELKKKQKELNNKLLKQKAKQKNLMIISILAIVLLFFGVVIWNKVLFPSEVTKYNAGEYLYYGPMRNGKPNGVGVAIYNKNDKDGRLYYYGCFVNGQRVDNNAIMFYKDGSYFKGSMNNDQWYKGVYYDISNEHFVGEFKNNVPFIGTWYKHVPVQHLNGYAKK